MEPLPYFLMGIGNKQRADDGVGVFIAENFTAPGWFVLNCETVPENFTSVVKKQNPEYLIIIDAAHMNLSPGAVRRVPPERLQDIGLGTHAMSLEHVIRFLKASVQKEIIMIGIEPKQIIDMEGVSQEILLAAQKVMIHLRNGSFHNIPIL